MATGNNGSELLPVRKVNLKVYDLTGKNSISYTPVSKWGETDHAGSKIHVSTFELSSKDKDGDPNTARVYQVDGVGGAGGLRYLPIAQLVMAICFARAAEKEAEVIKLMNALADTSRTIEDLSALENILVAFEEAGVDQKGEYPAYQWGAITDKDVPVSKKQELTDNWVTWLKDKGVDVAAYENKSPLKSADVTEILEKIESKLDSLNTTSQKDMITLQSETTKRDQTYDLVSAMVKSFSTGNTSIGSNLR